jgi:hypothetical protein
MAAILRRRSSSTKRGISMARQVIKALMAMALSSS